MASVSTTSASDTLLFVRKLRKKLRQIERLETVNRVLTDEEKLKVSCKDDIRTTLLEKLSDLGDESFADSNLSHETQDSSFANDGVDYLLNYTSEKHNDTELLERDNSLETNDSCTHEFEMKRKADDEVEEEEGEEEEVSTGSAHRPVKVSKTEQVADIVLTVDGADDAISKKHRNETSASTKQVKKADNKSSNSATSKPSKSSSQPSMSGSQPSKSSSPASSWASAKFSVHAFEGHNDLIVAVDCLEDTILSGGRDTMVKVWNMDTKEEQHSFGGHTNTVTSVKLLSSKENQRLENLVEDLAEGCELALSSSLDCSIKLWCISSSTLVHSMYTYNPVTCMDYFAGVGYIISGSDGGKVELWDIESGNNLFSTLAHDSVTCLWVDGSNAFSGSSEGIIKVWELREKSLATLYSSENLSTGAPCSPFAKKTVKCVASSNQKIYYGDDGLNIKVLAWKTGKVTKLKNQMNDFGLTDSVTVKEGLLISTGLDVDTGNSFINVRVLPEEIYVATVTDEDIGRIVNIAVTKNKEGSLRLVTAGSELIVLDLLKKHENRNQESLSIEFVASLSTKAYDTDQNTDSELSSADEEYGYARIQRRRSSSNSTKEAPSSSWTWCSVI